MLNVVYKRQNQAHPIYDFDLSYLLSYLFSRPVPPLQAEFFSFCVGKTNREKREDNR